MRWGYLVVLITAVVAGCGDDQKYDLRGPTTTATSSPQTAAAASPGNAADTTVCAALQDNGDGFYATYRHLLITGQGMSIDPLTLTAQLKTLAKVGDNPTEIDTASPKIRQAINAMVRDADRLAERYAAVANGAPADDTDLTPMINTFTEALIACAKAGHPPSWLDINDLTGH